MGRGNNEGKKELDWESIMSSPRDGFMVKSYRWGGWVGLLGGWVGGCGECGGLDGWPIIFLCQPLAF